MNGNPESNNLIELLLTMKNNKKELDVIGWRE